MLHLTIGSLIMVKRVIAGLFILICSVALTCGCDDNKNKKQLASIDDSVGNLTIFSLTQSNKDTLPLLLNLGHSFITIENTSSDNMTIGNYELTPNETICIGTWSISNHFGVWYNVESNYNSKYNRYDGRISLTKEISSNDITTITTFIAKHNYWNPFRNCSYFALNLWNSVADSNEKLKKPIIYSPTHVTQEIKKFNNYEYNRPLPTNSNMGYYSNAKFVSFNMKGEDKYV